MTWDTGNSVYAQRLDASGGVPIAIGATPPTSVLSLHPNYPNPFSAGTIMNIEPLGR